MSTLQTRALTGFAFAGIMAVGIFSSFYSFLGLFMVITGLSLWEFFGLALPEEAHKNIRKVYGTTAGLFVLGSFFLDKAILYSNTSQHFSWLAIIPIIAFFFIFALFIVELFLASAQPFQNIGLVFLGLVYIVLPYCLLAGVVCKVSMQSYRMEYHPALVFGLLLLVWASDSFAYLIGSRIGKTKLFPRISPGKTWEGSGGGVLGAMIAAVLLNYVFPNELPLQTWLGLAVLAVIFGTLGDLIESMLKRSLNVKDSGSLMPGHGGMLDRFDAFMFFVPWAVLFLSFAKA
jgi:phosphatidate cytidylyltransferase